MGDDEICRLLVSAYVGKGWVGKLMEFMRLGGVHHTVSFSHEALSSLWEDQGGQDSHIAGVIFQLLPIICWFIGSLLSQSWYQIISINALTPLDLHSKAMIDRMIP